VIKKRERFLFLKPLPPKRLKLSILRLGASFIKLAQVLATRADFFPQSYLDELKELHDEIPPMEMKVFKKVYRAAFENSPFLSFEESPIASASIGQVHIAYLQNGTKVAVKLRRYGIEDVVRADINILKFFNRLFKPLFSIYTKHSIESLIAEFSEMILKEVSLKNELDHLVEFQSHYGHLSLKTPTPFKELCSEDALVMSFMEGVRFDDKEGLENLNIPFEDIIEKVVLAYVEQMLINGFFHADPHPGNLLVDKDGNLILLDFGMVKRIHNRTRIAIIELVKSANERDFETYVLACKKLGIISDDAPLEEMQIFAEKMFDIFNNNNLDSANMQKLAFDVLGSMKELPFKLPQEAIYILRVSAIIEGLGTTYIENFNGVKDILPILQKNIKRALGAEKGVVNMFIEEVKTLPLTLKKLQNIINKGDSGGFEIRFSRGYEERLFEKLKDSEKERGLNISLLTLALLLTIYESSLFGYSLTLILVAIARIFYR